MMTYKYMVNEFTQELRDYPTGKMIVHNIDELYLVISRLEQKIESQNNFSNPFKESAKLGARIQRYYEDLSSIRDEMNTFKPFDNEDEIANESRKRLLDDLLDLYLQLFDDILTNGIAPDENPYHM